MPTYDYACRGCKHTYESYQQITEDPHPECPGCGKRLAYRKIGRGSAVIFKGPGFYATEHRKTR